MPDHKLVMSITDRQASSYKTNLILQSFFIRLTSQKKVSKHSELKLNVYLYLVYCIYNCYAVATPARQTSDAILEGSNRLNSHAEDFEGMYGMP